MSTATESELERQIRDEQEAHDAAAGEDPGEGKLFDVPRVNVILDQTDPTVLKLAFSGQINLDRGIPGDVDIYNSLQSGRSVTITVEAHVAGAKTTHRRDSEGDVDAVVQTKSLIIHSLDTSG